ncbi:MAG TPA: ECF-type sigma factor [Thermoanaerobaculia bacterium]|nr:ECF-type sigma factor [Thermoanaerobaculia bacterium]
MLPFEAQQELNGLAPSISALIASTDSGDRAAADALFSALYDELHGLAERQLRRQGGGLSLGVTTLLHEAYLDMSAREEAVFPDEARFLAYAAKVMRSLIVDYARDRKAQKRGGQFEITTLDEDKAGAAEAEDLEEIHAALERLSAIDPTLAEVVDLKFFCGFSFGEIAAMKSVSERTVQRHWEKARIFLSRSIREEALG